MVGMVEYEFICQNRGNSDENEFLLHPIAIPVERILTRATSRMLVFLFSLSSRWFGRRVGRPEEANLDNL